MFHKIDTKDLQTILDYLVTKPYKETFNLIALIQKATPIPAEVQSVPAQAQEEQK